MWLTSEEFVAEDSSKYDTMTKTVEVIRESSLVKNQTSTSDIFKNTSQNTDYENSWPSPISPFNTFNMKFQTTLIKILLIFYESNKK